MARLSVLIIYSQYLRICSHTLCLPAQICHFGRGQQCVTFFFTLFPPSWPLSSRTAPDTMFALITPKRFHSLLVLAFVSLHSFSSQLSSFQDACFSSLSAAFFPRWVLELTPSLSMCVSLCVPSLTTPPTPPLQALSPIKCWLRVLSSWTRGLCWGLGVLVCDSFYRERGTCFVRSVFLRPQVCWGGTFTLCLVQLE